MAGPSIEALQSAARDLAVSLSTTERKLDNERIAHMATRGSLDRVKGQLADLRLRFNDLATEMADDSSGDGGEERDPVGVGWERACKHYAEQIKKIMEAN